MKYVKIALILIILWLLIDLCSEFLDSIPTSFLWMYILIPVILLTILWLIVRDTYNALVIKTANNRPI